MDCSMPDSSVLHYLPKFAQIHVHWVGDAIWSSHPPLPPSSVVLSLSQHQDLFQWAGFSHEVAKVLELQHQFFWVAFDWFARSDLLGLLGTLKSLPQPQLESINSSAPSLLYGPTLIHTWLLESFDFDLCIALTVRTFVGKVMSPTGFL